MNAQLVSNPNRNNGIVAPFPYQQPQGNGTPSPQLQPQSQPLSAMADNPQTRPPLQSNHTRSSSFFSSFRNKTSHSEKGAQRTLSTIRQGSASSNAADEYGRSIQQQPGQNKLRQNGSLLSNQTSPSIPDTANKGHMLPAPQPLHPEIRSVVQLNAAHAHKFYYSGPLVRRIERQADGSRPAKDEGWTDVWGQLSGTTLSVWDMKQVEEASKQGKEVPPTYVNITDAFVHVAGSITVPATATSPLQKYSNVLTLNTAGSNLLLFSCPTIAALMSLASALRLCAWEKSRLEEIYTAHIIRTSLNAPNTPTTLVYGQLEGWVRLRVAGQTDWKKMWMVVNGPSDNDANEVSPPVPTKSKRMSTFLSRDHEPPKTSGLKKPTISMYTSAKPKDRKKAVLTMTQVTQAFAVYPERPELISRSTLIKVEGLIGDEHTAGGMRGREGWMLILPEIDSGSNPTIEMLRWIIALHDAFEMYGRPQAYTWDARDSLSMMFAYPVGPTRDSLFLEPEAGQTLDPREDRTSVARSHFLGILRERRRNEPIPGPQKPSPDLPPGEKPQQPTNSSGPQLPPLKFDPSPTRERLTPITERTGTQSRSPTAEEPPAPVMSSIASSTTLYEDRRQEESLLDRPINSSPLPLGPASAPVPAQNDMTSATPNMTPRQSEDSSRSDQQPNPANSTPNANLLPAVIDTEAHSSNPLPNPNSPTSTMDSRTRADPGLVSSTPFPSGPAPLPTDEPLNFSNEAGALWYVHQEASDFSRRVPTTISERDDESTAGTEPDPPKPNNRKDSDLFAQSYHSTDLSENVEDWSNPTPSELGARGSIKDSQRSVPDSEPTPHEENSDGGARGELVGQHTSPGPSHEQQTSAEDSDLLAAITYMNSTEPIAETNTKSPAQVDNPYTMRPVETPQAVPPPESPDGASQFKSSFAPSKQAEERKARSQAQQEAHNAAVHKPGRSNGKGKMKSTGAWGESSEEEEEEEEEDDDVDSDVEPLPVGNPQNLTPQDPDLQNRSIRPPPPPPPPLTPLTPLRPPPPRRSLSPSSPAETNVNPSTGRPVRHLPQIPTGKSPVEASDPMQRRQLTEPFPDAGRRTYYDDGPHLRSQSEFPQPGTARQTVWSQVLEPGRQPGPPPELPNNNNRGTFVQLESHSMTKPFAPQGLLSAGLQDKQDRSAKRQEEIARESGGSLVNVPNKPPPPQTGFLGAITAYERERKREGGVGAALTEREREKRLAEEKQRRFDEQQRQQMNQMAQGGSMYGGPLPPYNPMMANPMMMGMNPMMAMNPMMTGAPMNPMMTGAPMNPMMTGSMGFPGMMAGYHPQHMFAAQQAAQAYQQAMMAFSVAGSQVGGEGGNAQPPLNPMMTGSMFDPRMSMMSMPMMGGPPMGTPMGMGMQSTGGPGFDGGPPQMLDPGLIPPGQIGGQFSSQGSTGGRGSPLARMGEAVDSNNARPSRQNSPKPL